MRRTNGALSSKSRHRTTHASIATDAAITPQTALAGTPQQNEDTSALFSPIIAKIPVIEAASARSVDDGGSTVLDSDDAASLSRVRPGSPLSSRVRKRLCKRAPSISAASRNVVQSTSTERPAEEYRDLDSADENVFDLSLWVNDVFDSPSPTLTHVESLTTESADSSSLASSSHTSAGSILKKYFDQNGCSMSEAQMEQLMQTSMMLLCNPALLATLMVYFNSPDIIQTMQSIHAGRVNLTNEANILGDPTYNLPDSHPIFANVVRLIPLRLRDCKSKLINLFTARRTDYNDAMYRQSNVHTVPPSTAFLGAASGIYHPSIPSYPLPILDRHGKTVLIDNKDYYVGRYRAPFELACHKFHGFLIGEVPIPEVFERFDFMLQRLVGILIQCVLDAFNELGYVSYGDKIFRMVHFFGILLAVWGSRVDFRNYLKRATRGAALEVLHYRLTKETKQSKTGREMHEARCKFDAYVRVFDRNYVKPFASRTDIQCDYTNELFFHAVMKGLFLDDNRIGRLFRSFFKNCIPIPSMAFFATMFLNTFEEVMIDGTIGGIDFCPELYFPEFQYHLFRLNDLMASSFFGPLLKAALEDWAAVGCSLQHNGARTVQKLKSDLRNFQMRKESMRSTLPTYTSVFSANADSPF